MGETITVALGGNPNCGKTTVFNALTGLRHKVANYPGVTVERRSGSTTGPNGEKLEILDLPGVYSLAERSPDEEAAVAIVVGRMPDEPRPDVIINVCDATNLERNLYLTTQLIEVGVPVVVALSMMDVARRRGAVPDTEELARVLGVPVVPLEPDDPERWNELKRTAIAAVGSGAPERVVEFPEELTAAVAGLNGSQPFGAVLRELTAAGGSEGARARVSERTAAVARRLDEELEDWWKAEPAARYRWIDENVRGVMKDEPGRRSRSEAIDRVVLHRVLGPFVFVVIMGMCFQAVFSWASVPMDLLGELFGTGSEIIGEWIGPGLLRDLVIDGVLAGVLNVLIFLPQIAILFLILGFLEDSGYLARAAFIMDEPMRRVGLHGRSFVPMLSSFACAIPGIMGTRTISHAGARLVTILVAPLMSCSARLPVYTLIIGAFFADGRLFGGVVSTAAVVMLAAYLLGIVAAACVAFVLRKTVIRGEAPTLIMELPPYRRPRPLPVLRNVFDRGLLFVKKAWTVILLFTILLWFLQNFPRDEAVLGRLADAEDRIEALEADAAASPTALEAATADRNAARREILRGSFAGTLGRGIEPVLKPIGLDWQMGIGILASFAAREVLVSTLAQVYGVDDDDEGIAVLTDRLRELENPETGRARYTPLAGLSLLVFFVLACQCVSTIAVARRETNGWRWPIFMFVYMTVLAWGASFATWQVGTALGYGP